MSDFHILEEIAVDLERVADPQVHYMDLYIAARLKASWRHHHESPQCRDFLLRFAALKGGPP